MSKNILIGALVVVVIMLAVILLVPKNQDNNNLGVIYSPSPVISPVASPFQQEKAQKMYRSDKYGFLIEYPSYYSLTMSSDSMGIFRNGSGEISLNITNPLQYRYEGPIDACIFTFENPIPQKYNSSCPTNPESYRFKKTESGTSIYNFKSGDVGYSGTRFVTRFSPCLGRDYVLELSAGADGHQNQKIFSEQELAMKDAGNIISTIKIVPCDHSNYQ